MTNEQQHVGFGKRLAAYLIDSIVIFLVVQYMVVPMLIASIGGLDYAHTQEGTRLIGERILLFGPMIYIAYFTLMESSSKQGTLGKILMKIKVVNSDYKKLSIVNALGRSVSRIISGIILGIGYIMVLFTKNKQALHDKLAKTYVINK